MLFKNSKKVTKEPAKVSVITNEQKMCILDFLQGAVYCWCKNRTGEEFALRDLVGGDNSNWNGTSLQCVYDGYHRENAATAITTAGQASGRLLMRCLMQDKRNFNLIERDVNHYSWSK